MAECRFCSLRVTIENPDSEIKQITINYGATQLANALRLGLGERFLKVLVQAKIKTTEFQADYSLDASIITFDRVSSITESRKKSIQFDKCRVFRPKIIM